MSIFSKFKNAFAKKDKKVILAHNDQALRAKQTSSHWKAKKEAFKNADIKNIKGLLEYLNNSKNFIGEDTATALKEKILAGGVSLPKDLNIPYYGSADAGRERFKKIFDEPTTRGPKGRTIMDRVLSAQPVVANATTGFIVANMNEIIELLAKEKADASSLSELDGLAYANENLAEIIAGVNKDGKFKNYLDTETFANFEDTKLFDFAPIKKEETEEVYLARAKEEVAAAIKACPTVALSELRQFVADEKNAQYFVTTNLGQIREGLVCQNTNREKLIDLYNTINKEYGIILDDEVYNKQIDFQAGLLDESMKARRDETIAFENGKNWFTNEELADEGVIGTTHDSCFNDVFAQYRNNLVLFARCFNFARKSKENPKEFEVNTEFSEPIAPVKLFTLMANKLSAPIKKANPQTRYLYRVLKKDDSFDKETDAETLLQNVIFLTVDQDRIMQEEYDRLCQNNKTPTLSAINQVIGAVKSKTRFEDLSFEVKKELYNWILEERQTLFGDFEESKAKDFDTFFIQHQLNKKIVENIDTVQRLVEYEACVRATATLQKAEDENNQEIADNNALIADQSVEYNDLVKDTNENADLVDEFEEQVDVINNSRRSQNFIRTSQAVMETRDVPYEIPELLTERNKDGRTCFDKDTSKFEAVDIEKFDERNAEHLKATTEKLNNAETALTRREIDFDEIKNIILDFGDGKTEANLAIATAAHTSAITKIISQINEQVYANTSNRASADENLF